MAKSKRKLHVPDVPVVVKIDRKLKAKWLAAFKRLTDAMQKGASAFDARYHAIDEILSSHPPLYLAGGFESGTAFLASIGDDLRTATRNVRVAQFATPADDATYGPTKLDAAITLVEARHRSGHTPIAFDKLRIPTKAGDKSLHDASIEEIRVATRALQHAPSPSANPQVAAVAAVLKSPGLKSVRVRFAGGHFTLTEISPDAIMELGRALAKAHVPKLAGPVKKKTAHQR